MEQKLTNRFLKSLSLPQGWFAGNRTAALMFLVGVAMSVFAVGAVVKIHNQISSSFADLRETRDFETETIRILNHVIEAQTSYRGYLFTGDEELLQPYAESKAMLDAELKHLTHMARGEEKFAPVIERYAAVARGAMEAASQAIDARRAGNESQNASIARVMDIRMRVEATRAINAEFQEILRGQLAERRNSLNSTIQTLLFTVVVLLLGLILVSFAQARELVLQAKSQMLSQTESEARLVTLSQSLDASRSELQSLHRRLALALRSAHVKVFSIDREGLIHWASETEIGLLSGRSLPVLIQDLAIDVDRPQIALAVKEIFTSGVAGDFEMRTCGLDGSLRWVRITLSPDGEVGDGLSLGSAVDISDIKHREEANFLLMRELSHRSKNLLAIVQAITRQTARTSESIKEFERRLSSRLRALAAGHDLMVGGAYSGADLGALIRSQMGLLTRLIGDRIALDGPEIKLRPEAAQNIGMAIHELAMNAEIHGALSTETGNVSLTWAIDGSGADRRLRLDWVETGGPTPAPAQRKGFGTVIIAQNLPRALLGEVTLSHEPEGTRCHVSLLLSRVVAHADPLDASELEIDHAE
ncbi:MAG: CHASE3 domain-containing protein [Proteobacteria bacterium]|nr:CHASE3 domain-containing protein [Pseudomonadota bacterium]